VRRAYFHNGTSLYEINLGKPMRYHVVCKATNTVEELDGETSDELNAALTKIEEKLRARGYAGVGHIVEFFGIAPQSASLAPAAASAPVERQNTGMPVVN
jgi:Fur family ferric uptake transcriptional regulator